MKPAPNEDKPIVDPSCAHAFGRALREHTIASIAEACEGDRKLATEYLDNVDQLKGKLMKHAKYAIVLTMFSLLTTVCYAQTHQPTHTVNGRVVTVDAEIAKITPNPESLVEGTMLTDKSLVYSPPGEPIIWTLSPGTYSLQMMGYADDPANPDRALSNVDIVVVMTRQEEISAAYAQLGQAILKIHELLPTYTEFTDAINNKVPNAQPQ